MGRGRDGRSAGEQGIELSHRRPVVGAHEDGVHAHAPRADDVALGVVEEGRGGRRGAETFEGELEDRSRRRAQLQMAPGWKDYAAKAKPFYVKQECRIMTPLPWSPVR